jgi:hypothetical protein
MSERRIEELKSQLATLNASIARLAAIGVELSENLAEAEMRQRCKPGPPRGKRSPPV